MKRILLCILFVALTSVSCGDDTNKETPVVSKVPTCIFMGDSITEIWYRLRESFFIDNSFVSKGIGGQTTTQMLARFSDDVVYYTPKVVSILGGINDIGQNQGYVTNEQIMSNIAAMAQKADRAHIKVILCSVLPASIIGWRPAVQPAAIIKDLNARIKQYAADHSFLYLDYYSALADENGGLPSNLTSDGVHPTEACYKIMETMFLNAIATLKINL